MKKILLSAGMLICAIATQAQDCKAEATLNEDFSDFTISQSFATAFPQKCWTSFGSVASGPWIYTEQTTDKNNQYVTFYSHMTGANVPGYVISPELSTINGNHELSFETFKPTGPNGQIAPGAITIQVGTLTSLTDMATFEAVGTPYDVTDKPVPHPNIIIPASATAKYVAFKFISATSFNAATLDNVVWSEIPCEAVATLDENFDAFDAAKGFSQNCWNKIVSSNSPATNSMVYLKKTETNVEAIYYSSTGITETPFLVTPEISTFDGKHALSFNAYKTTAGNVTVQVGTLSNPADASTFVAFGEPKNLVALSTTGTVNTYADLILPASTTQKYIALKFTADAVHNSARIDNIKWAAKTAGIADLAKNKFSIFPNPSSDKNVTIAYAGADKANVTVFSVTGAKVFETIVNGTNANLNLSSLSSGMYIIKLTAGNATATQKLVIQ